SASDSSPGGRPPTTPPQHPYQPSRSRPTTVIGGPVTSTTPKIRSRIHRSRTVAPPNSVGGLRLSVSVPEHPLRHSLAGVQLKYPVSEDRLTFPVSGQGGWWIAKLADRSLRELASNEYLTMRWLAAAGFPVPPVHLEPAGAVGGIPEGLV